MGRLIVSMNLSVDGYIEGPGREDGSWVRIDEEVHTYVNRLAAGADALLYRRKVYEVMIPYWPDAAEDASKPAYEMEFGRIWTSKPKVVFSTTLKEARWTTRDDDLNSCAAKGYSTDRLELAKRQLEPEGEQRQGHALVGRYRIGSMHDVPLILTLTGGLSAALVLGYITQRLGLSPIVGYLLAGTLVGPHTPGFVADTTIAEQLAEIGVILLMFGVGLQFHIEELLAVRRVAIPGAIAQSAVATALGAVIARGFGWDWSAGIVFGMALAVASTVVLVRILADNRDLHTPAGHIAVGWLVVEDLFTVVALVLLPALFGGPSSGSSLAMALVLTAVKIAGLVAFAVVVGNRFIPRLLDHVAASRSRELFTLTVLVLALGIAVGTAMAFGVSMALGAFLAGMVVGRSEYSLRAASEALPMRDAFAVLFFVSVGMLLDPGSLIQTPGIIVATLAVVILGKPLVALLIVRLMRYPFKVALAVAIALAQIGEFSFILSSIGRDLGILTPAATNTLVAVSIVSIVINPLLYRTIPRVERWASARPRMWRLLNPSAGVGTLATAAVQETTTKPEHRAVVVGYGPTGRTVTRLLRENGIEPTVIELNVKTVRQLRHEGVNAIYGDVTQRETLVGAGVSSAGHLILASAGMGNSAEAIRMARDLNPTIRVVARASYLRDLPELKKAGADAVFTGEGEVALAFTEAILQELGATPEQIDRERDRAHTELFGESPDTNLSTVNGNDASVARS